MNGMDAAREWQELEGKLSDYVSVYDGPIPSLTDVNTIPDAPLCGSGKVTVALDSKEDEVHYHLSKSDFWYAMLRPEMLFQKHHIRQAPLCRLALKVHNAASGGDGLRHLQDMSSAEIRSALPLDGGLLNIRCVALAQRDMLVYEIEAEGAAASVTAEVETGNENESFFVIKGHHDEGTVWLRKEHTSFITVNAAVAMRTMGATHVRALYDKGFKSALSFDVEPGKKVRLLLSVKGGKDEYHHLEEALAALDETGPAVIDRLLADHTEWWKAFWLRSWVDLGDPMLERYYYGAQYVLGCSIDLDGRTVPGLAGGWITTDSPIWGGTYTMNYNGEAPFWGLASSNRGDWLLPYARVCLDYIEEGRKLAQRLDTRGVVMPVMIGPWGIPDNDDALGQKSNASMAALSLIWHYESTLDAEFLEQVLYPYLRELMDFWEDNLELDETGRYVILGSARECMPGDLNPGEDIAYVHRILDVMIPASEQLGLDSDRRALWCDYRSRLSDYPVAIEDGDLCYKEAENRMKVSHKGPGDNVCALNPVYPGGALDSDPGGKGRIVARNTLRYLQSWNQANSFTRVFSQAVRAEWSGGELLDIFKRRLTSGEGAHERLRRNNTFLPADHSFEGTAGTEFINSMLAHAHGGVLKVLHVWPKDRDAACKRIRVCGAFLVSGTVKDGEVTAVEILSEKGQPCRMLSCWPGHGIVVDRVDGSQDAVELQSHSGVYTWSTEISAVYRVTRGVPTEMVDSNQPIMVVPIIEPEARATEKHTDADLDIVLSPDVQAIQLTIDAVYTDESRRDVTSMCRFTTRNGQVVSVDADGRLAGTGRGRALVDVQAEVDGVSLACTVSVYVLTVDVVAGVKVTVPQTVEERLRPAHWNNPHSLEKSYGMDSPDLTARMRANSYGFGCYTVPFEGECWIQFDLGEVVPLDEMWVWNFNSPDNYRVLWWNGGTACGMRDVTIETSEDGAQWTELTTKAPLFRLARATGRQWMPATNLDEGLHSPIRFHGMRARYVKLTPVPGAGIGNWGGTSVGLGQVRFTRFSDTRHRSAICGGTVAWRCVSKPPAANRYSVGSSHGCLT